MIAKLIKIGLPLLAFALCVGAYLELRKANARLRGQVAAARAQNEQTVRLREGDQHLQALVNRARIDEDDALRAIHAEAEHTRAEVVELERRAEARYAAKLEKDRAAAAALSANRDLTKGLVLVENCRNAGNGSPVDAFQTLVWAAQKGDDETLAGVFVLPGGAARAICEGILAMLPEGARKKYPTPEALASLAIADTLMNVSAVQVLGQTTEDAQHATINVARLSGDAMELPMRLGPNGWQVVLVDTKFLKQFKAKLLGGTPPPEPKK